MDHQDASTFVEKLLCGLSNPGAGQIQSLLGTLRQLGHRSLMSLPEEDRDDVLQMCLIRIWQRAGHLRAMATRGNDVIGYVARVVRNVCYDRFRTRKRERRSMDSLQQAAMTEPVCDSEDPSLALGRGELEGRMLKAIDRLEIIRDRVLAKLSLLIERPRTSWPSTIAALAFRPEESEFRWSGGNGRTISDLLGEPPGPDETATVWISGGLNLPSSTVAKGLYRCMRRLAITCASLGDVED